MESAPRNHPKNPADLLTADEVGQLLRLPRSTVYHLATTGNLPSVRFGRSWRFPAAEIRRLAEGGGYQLREILVLDDDITTREIVVSALMPRGCRVTEAGSIREGLLAVQRQRFDLLLVDLKLPDGLGTEFVRAVHTEVGLERIVVITAFPDLAEAGDLLEVGAIRLLRKPLAIRQLLECVENVIGARLPAERHEVSVSPRPSLSL